jgi:hypothetical protein
VIFWQSARTTKQARPAVSVPTARAAGRVLDIVVDSHERYAWKFEQQQATTIRRALFGQEPPDEPPALHGNEASRHPRRRDLRALHWGLRRGVTTGVRMTERTFCAARHGASLRAIAGSFAGCQ